LSLGIKNKNPKSALSEICEKLKPKCSKKKNPRETKNKKIQILIKITLKDAPHAAACFFLSKILQPWCIPVNVKNFLRV